MSDSSVKIDFNVLSERQSQMVAEHYSDVVDIMVRMNNTIVAHLGDVGLNATQAAALNEWSKMVTDVLAASEFQVRRIIGEVPEFPIDPRKRH